MHFLGVDTGPDLAFWEKNKEKRLKTRGDLLNLWLNFVEYRFLCSTVSREPIWFLDLKR